MNRQLSQSFLYKKKCAGRCKSVKKHTITQNLINLIFFSYSTISDSIYCMPWIHFPYQLKRPSINFSLNNTTYYLSSLNLTIIIIHVSVFFFFYMERWNSIVWSYIYNCDTTDYHASHKIISTVRIYLYTQVLALCNVKRYYVIFNRIIDQIFLLCHSVLYGVIKNHKFISVVLFVQ